MRAKNYQGAALWYQQVHLCGSVALCEIFLLSRADLQSARLKLGCGRMEAAIAVRTRSESPRARSLFMIRARWISTVLGEMLSSLATSLLERPATSCSSTCTSLGVSSEICSFASVHCFCSILSRTAGSVFTPYPV